MPDQVQSNTDLATTPAPAGVAAVPRHLLRVGGLEVRRVIGRGGMGTVYEAWDESASKSVAVKVLADHVSASPQAVTRFQREAQAASQLDHPNITRIFSQGEDQGIHFYAMELVDGTSVHQIIAAARNRREHLSDPAETILLPRGGTREASDSSPGGSGGGRASERAAALSATASIERAVKLAAGECSPLERCAYIAEHIATVADALHHAHESGVIHRDIKPHNLLMGSDGRLRVTDFGLARLMAEPGVTVTGEMIGSPLYMSAEQVSGGPAMVDHRTDVYSLGATMYEWLTLRPPFPGESREQVITRLLQGDAPALRQMDATIPADLETICLKALERDRRRRYGSAAEMRDDLRRFLEGRRIKARRAGLRTRLARSMRRHQFRWAGGSAIVLSLIVTGVLYQLGNQARVQTELAEQATAKATAVAEDRDQLLRSVREVFREQLPLEISGPVRILEAGLPVVQGLVERAPEVSGEAAPAAATGADPSRVDTPLGIGRRLVNDLYDAVAGQGGSDEDDLMKVLRLAEDMRGSDPAGALSQIETYLRIRPQDVVALRLKAALHLSLGDTIPALAILEPMTPSAAAPPGPAELHLWRGLARFLAGEHDRAIAELNQAAGSAELSHWIQATQALVGLETGAVDQSLALIDAVLQAHPDWVPALLTRATGLAARKDLTAAVADMSRVIEIEPDNADVYAARGDFLSNIPDYAAAAEDYQKAIALGGPSAPINLRWLMARMAVGRDDEAAADSAPAQPAGEAEVPPEVWSDHMQRWFSERVWPPASGTTPPDPVAPPTSPRVPTPSVPPS